KDVSYGKVRAVVNALYIYFSVFLCLSVSFTIVVPPDPVVAHVGSTVILPCWISPPENAEALEIRWYRHNHAAFTCACGRMQCNLILEYIYLYIRIENYRGLILLSSSKQLLLSLTLCAWRRSKRLSLLSLALGSAPVLSPEPLDDGRVNISCRSSGWHPKPSITWTSDNGRALRPGGTSHSRGADEMFSVHSWTAVSLSDTKLVSCSLSLRSGELKESRVHIQAIYSDSSGPWKALFLTLLISVLLGLVGLILYKYREKLTGSFAHNP
uniref:Ig-like domain-containing protein n=1 Tax=Cyprinus carpio TaxID=7962 RepID=A0A8C2CP10_CYPCA